LRLRLCERPMVMPGSRQPMTGKCTPPAKSERLSSSRWRKQQVRACRIYFRGQTPPPPPPPENFPLVHLYSYSPPQTYTMIMLLNDMKYLFRGLPWPGCEECCRDSARLLQWLTETGECVTMPWWIQHNFMEHWTFVYLFALCL
jgi:hypothetical protein